ncbi:MAG: ISAs1 family transposase [Opitutus sp.]|nr:ISAs1 family transposase [Opitutus sp.]
MIRDHIGLLTLAQHEDGAPQAVAVYDQKEGTARCEQSAATALLTSVPALNDKTVTADALHCQRPPARLIVEKGGDYLLQIKGNQPTLLARAEACNAQPATLFSPHDPGHGRVVTRGVHAFAFEPLAADFPYARALIVVRCTRTVKRTAITTDEVRYYLASAEPTAHTPAQWLALIQGHWAGVEIRNHWRRDAVWGEDRSRTRKPNALANLALHRSALLALLPDHFPDLSLPKIKERPHSEWRLSFCRAAVVAAMTDLAVVVARPVEQGILLGSALHRSGFPTVGTQGYKIGGDDPQHFGPE